MTKRIRLKEIVVDRLEGYEDECGPKVARTYREADSILQDNSDTAPKCGAYDKHDVTLRFADGHEVKLRMDIQHPSVEAPERISDHVKWCAKAYGGLLTQAEQPKHWQPGTYESMMRGLAGETSEGWRKVYEQYQLED